MNAVRKIVVVGGGPGGGGGGAAAKQQDAAADVVLLSDESQEPYEKPPLSKAVLTGKAMPHDALIAGPKGVAASGVRLKLGTPVKAIDRAARTVMADAGERIGYDALVLATGSINRLLPMFPARQRGGYYLRTEGPAPALKGDAAQGASASRRLAPRHRRRPDRVGSSGIRRGARRQDNRDRDRAAHPRARV